MPGGRAEAHLAEVVHAVDRRLEPAERLGTHGLQDEALDVDLHLHPELVVELLAAAVEIPGDPGDVVEPDAGAGDGRAEQHGRRVLAGPVVGPCEAALDQPLVDGVERLVDADHGARGQHLEGHGAVGEGFDVLGEDLEHADLVRSLGDHRLDANLHRLVLGERGGNGYCCHQSQSRQARDEPPRDRHVRFLRSTIVFLW